ncbi:thrombospondin-3-like, partial [Thamnophis elegans]|uniref:thrombospondin-3-like n=1 Tax=Thamnophis elegans TaxID=35005 RepID=UPI0013787679
MQPRANSLRRRRPLPASAALLLLLWGAASGVARRELQVIDLLTVTETRHMTNVANKIRTEILSVHDMYLLSTFHLPPKQGGPLFGLHYKKDNSRWFEVSVVGKTNKVLVRYLRADGKLHSVNLQNSNLSDGRSHTLLLRVSGLKASSLSLELYVDCKLLDSNRGLPELASIDQEKTEPIEVRTGQKTYLRMEGSLESLKLILGGSLGRVGALSECPFQEDESMQNT